MLTRPGNKTRLVPTLQMHFPEKIDTFIDLFFGTGAVTRSMVGKVRHIIANDADSEVFNLYRVLQERRADLLRELTIMPVHQSLFNHWTTHQESDPVRKAVRFLLLSNFSLYSKCDTFKSGVDSNEKRVILDHIEGFFCDIAHVRFFCLDFRAVLPILGWRTTTFGRSVNQKADAFLYLDPPYANTTHTYAGTWSETDTQDIFEVAVNSGMRFAISEFRSPLILRLAEAHKLNVHSLGERRNIKNRREELLITNYPLPQRQAELPFSGE